MSLKAIEWEWTPPEESTDLINWCVQVLEDGSIKVTSSGDELVVPPELAADLASEVRSALERKAKGK